LFVFKNEQFKKGAHAMNWQDQLIYVYLNVCEFFLQESPAQNLRISPNSNPTFTDQEVITIYIFGIMQGYTTIKKIHKYITEHLYEWFPEIPQYAGYDYRLNLLEEVLNKFGIFFIQKLNCKNKNKENIIVVDSFPIILAKGFRSTCAKVAKSVCSQGYCASKKLYYWGLKLHLFADYADETLPIPRLLKITTAKTHDLTAVKGDFIEFINSKFIGDKAYGKKSLKADLLKNKIELHTPIKFTKTKKTLTSDESAYSKIVSSFRQSIEIFFNWIIEMTGIQNASKTRSKKGLMVHMFGRLAAMMILYQLNF